MKGLFLCSNTESPLSSGFWSIAQGHQCSADADCGPEKFCLSSRREEAVCSPCRGIRRRCHRDAMCCTGSHCLNDVCTVLEGQAAEKSSKDGESRNAKSGKKTKKPDGHKRKEVQQESQWERLDSPQAGKGLEGETCLRTSDCSTGLCCARHFWSKICRPVLKEGQVCSKRGRKEGPQGPEIFQRCACGPGLTCRNQNQQSSQGTSRLWICQRI
ncbi:dickkopf-related protein 4-like [Hypanus sabinus]|uniref:dickkopf-related protein 4-like n=1 Tax=Hypanus sabinus TaxID=79690 RepID=UPI0028C43111|nr:dickkopf-related protein 4-like [Hypanus sabinus]